jgi:hypothetical protein
LFYLGNKGDAMILAIDVAYSGTSAQVAGGIFDAGKQLIYSSNTGFL